MTRTIAIAGKGGTGKTTVAAMLIKYLIANKRGSILAVDADPASNLNLVLGMPLSGTVGDIREDMLAQVQSGAMSQGMSKQNYLDYEVRAIVTESRDVDLLAMGRPEGPGCYCAANAMLRLIIDAIGKAYDYVVIDNEAGMEHLSRRTTRDVDVLLLVTDPTVRGVSTAGQMAELSRKLKINVGRVYLIVNRLDGTMPAAVQQAIERMNVPLVGIVPGDPQLAEFDSTGQPLIEIDDGSVAYRAIARIAEKILDSEVMRQRSSLSTYPLAT